ncbi:endonuclease [Vibrio fluvialis]|uniref:endonuclease n=1 Tax=Vibrio fluvialis TaxID=676 RepID=UPI002572BF20|nr:endonuclease [Vibrio fluvialis]BEI26604.1 endonuclease [Vibrio fluvialis]
MKKALLLLVASPLAFASGNTSIESFNTAKRLMQEQIFVGDGFQTTLYCGAKFNANKEVTLPDGFVSTKYKDRLKTWEAEHISAAESWGKSFVEWREGHPSCVDNKGKSFKGRNCASKVNKQYRLMQSDLYNLAPSIGAVNGMRKNYNFTMMPNAKSSFGSCDMRIENRKVQPPESARGRIARAYLYFDEVYSRYSMSKAQRQLMMAWDKQYPVTPIECEIGRRIKLVQKSSNP